MRAGFVCKGPIGGRYKHVATSSLTIHDFGAVDFTDTNHWQPVAAAGSVYVSATDSPTIEAASGAVALAEAIGEDAGAGASIGISIALNTITDTVRAAIDNARVTTSTRDVDLTATDGATIQAVSVGVAVAAASASGRAWVSPGRAPTRRTSMATRCRTPSPAAARHRPPTAGRSTWRPATPRGSRPTPAGSPSRLPAAWSPRVSRSASRLDQHD